MSIEADDRRAAFLREMGISEWMPKSRGEEAPLISSESTVIDAAPTLEPEPFASPLVVDDAIARRERISRLDWPTLRTEVAGCVACDLCKSRRQTVFGVGAEQAPWMLIGEAPGAEE
ncbi:MAG TPA: uracil-DNA glycosylase, partial [Burkholderiaceae bacterium]|nr:uracil-DNA glycosylase [Burkholderiaceae bacterium]